MTVAVDTSVLIDHLRGDDRARRLVGDVARSGPCVSASALTKIENLAGVPTDETEATRRPLDRLKWTEIAERAGRLAAHSLRSHPGSEVVDYVIAASAQRLNADLLTRDVRRFPVFPELAIPYGP